MFYIALSFLVGILWINFKAISTFVLLMLIFLIYIKKIRLSIALLIMISSLISYYILDSYNQTLKKEQDLIKSNPKINDIVSFNYIKIQKDHITGTLTHNDNIYRFFYNKIHSNIMTSINHHNCKINGEYKFNRDEPIIMIKKITIDSCISNNKFAFINHHKDKISDKIYHSGVRYPDQILALITGNPSLINPDYRESVKDIGIYHLLAISGTHVAAIIIIIQQSLVRFNILSLIIKIITIVVLILYAIYTNFIPSAVRAISIAILILILPKSIKHSSLNLLSFIFITMFIINPGYIYNIGFQFSFLICLFILLAQPFLKNLANIQSIFALTCIAQYASIIISTYHFNQYQWIGFFSNLLFVPFYSFILLPLIIFFFIAMHFMPQPEILIQLINVTYKTHDYLLNLFLQLNKFKWFIPSLNETMIILLLITVFSAYYLLVYNGVIQSLILFLTILFLISSLSKPSHGEITLFDVGQGDSILFKSKSNKIVLIDTGGKGDENKNVSHHNIAKYKILPSLKRKGITTIDYLIITHPHADHMGELPYMIENLTIKNIILNSYNFPQHYLDYILNECKKKQINSIEAKSISQIKVDDAKLNFFDTYLPHSSDRNEYSIITLIEYNSKNILLMGDATKNNEDILLEKYHLPQIDILKVGHHGSRTSSSEAFIRKIQPKISLISSGVHNKYKLPNKDVIERLKQYGSLVYDTQENGEITIDLDKQQSIVMSIYRNQKSIAREATQ